MPIRVLEPTIAAQIAAGEVIENPASVVKELVENALDAGARNISIEVNRAGMQEIKVQDDGCGMNGDEIELAFTRHATSKLQTVDDLWQIGTLGFRGEALPSIASVSQVVCLSRTADEDMGTEVRFAGGELQARTPKGGARGTTISVRNLFYNTPVRRDYLRADATEASAINTIVQHYALAYPAVRFTLILNGRLSLKTNGKGSLQDVAIEVYGVDVARQLLPLSEEVGAGDDFIALQGLLSPPGLTRSNRNSVYLFVNQRAIHPRGIILHVITEAYHTLLMKGKYPLVIINITLPPHTVDVNVHPAKSEVRFRSQQRVLHFIGRSVRATLLQHTDVQSWTKQPSQRQQRQPHSSAWKVGSRVWSVQNSYWDVGGGGNPPITASVKKANPVETPTTDQTSDISHQEAAKPSSKGDTGNTTPPPNPVIDSSPSMTEEELFPDETPKTRDDQAMTVMTNPSSPRLPGTQPPPVDHLPAEGQSSPPPPIMSDHPPSLPANEPEPSHSGQENTPDETEKTSDKLPPLRVIGQVGLTYLVAESPEGMYMIDQHAAHERIAYERLMALHRDTALDSQQLLTPQTLKFPPDITTVLLDAADTLAQWGFALEPWGDDHVRVRALPTIVALENLHDALLEIAAALSDDEGSTPDDWRETMLITLACHTSVRAGQSLSLNEMRELLRQLERCDNPRTCPHGRPTMVLLTPSQLERQFGRMS